jgi:thiol:disulfide interchange protein DsbD
VKVGAGFLELALVFYYLAKADFGFFGLGGYMSREMVLAVWVGLMVATSAWLLGVWRFNKDPESKGIGFGRATWAFLFGVFGIWLATGLVGNHLGAFETVLPISEKRVQTGTGSGEAAGEFLDYDEALAAAKKESKPVFVDFTGFT